MIEVDPEGGLRGLQPPLWEVFKLVWLSMSIPFLCPKNIISYNVSSSQIDRYKKTVAIPPLDYSSSKCKVDFLTKIAKPAVCFVSCHRL